MVIHDRIRAHFQLGSHGATVLLRLMQAPAEFGPKAKLGPPTGAKASDCIKVYICRIRRLLDKFGFSAGSIETAFGPDRSSYRLSPEAVSPPDPAAD